MKTGCKGAMLGLMFAAASVVSAAESAPKEKRQFSDKQRAQQQRMTDCAADAKQKGLRGDDRPAFMKTCLSGGMVTVTVGDQTASVPEPPAAAP